jgi:SAM-dependent methyltransferase
MNEELSSVQQAWEKLGRKDPLWAVLTYPRMKGGKWKQEDFFARGEEEIQSTLGHLARLGRTVRTGRALDFGCGVGRLSRALSFRFDKVDAVDISTSMIERARALNRDRPQIKFHINVRADLTIITDHSIDFLYSNIVLQHMDPALVRSYLREFARVLAPDGVLVFQMPSAPAVNAKGLLVRILPDSLLTWLRHGMQMHAIQRAEVEALLKELGLSVLDVQRDTNPGNKGWVSFFYYSVADRR